MSAEELSKVLSERIQSAKIPKMVVTMGGEGAVYADQNGESGVYPALKVDVVDTTGAGDAFFSGVYRTYLWKDFKRSMRDRYKTCIHSYLYIRKYLSKIYAGRIRYYEINAMESIIIGIAGGSGSGKSTFTNRVKKYFGDDITVIYHDNYYHRQDGIPYEKRVTVNYDHPDSLETDLLVKHLKQLKAGKTIECPVYDYNQHNRSDEIIKIEPKPVILVEEILSLADERILRRILRDVEERGRDLHGILRLLGLRFLIRAKLKSYNNINNREVKQMNLTRTSKYVSLLLRHKPEKAGIHLDQHGWAEVDELIKGVSKTHMFNMEILEEIVRTDNKQRYSFNEDKTKIRANQGHSIPVDVELKEAKPPKQLWHGTGEKYVSAIDEQGLLHKNRLYVHLSTNEETAIKVGKRHGKPVLYTVNAEEMYQDGYKFFLSKNGVWLTDHVPVKYLDKYKN